MCLLIYHAWMLIEKQKKTVSQQHYECAIIREYLEARARRVVSPKKSTVKRDALTAISFLQMIEHLSIDVSDSPKRVEGSSVIRVEREREKKLSRQILCSLKNADLQILETLK